MTVREEIEVREKQILASYAAFAADSRGREREETPCPYRTVYQRDRDRVVHSKSFRRLKHKTQVFLSPEGDHYRTRLTHTLEVSQIARTIARALRLNEDLTEAVSLAHDLGHTPFGHAGERALNELLDGGFRHYEHSVRVVEKLEHDSKGLNLTAEVRDGILCHTKGATAQTLEGRIVRFADQIAYINHDMDDAMRAGVMSESDIPIDVRTLLGETRAQRLDCLIGNVIKASDGTDIRMAPAVYEAFQTLHQTMFDKLYFNPVVKGEETKAVALLQTLFEYYEKNPAALPPEFVQVAEEEGAPRAAADYVASMTDNFALGIYDSLFVPRSWTFKA